MIRIEQLAQEWLDAKAAEDTATKRRHDVEAQIVALLGHPEDGSKTHNLSGVKIVTTGRLSYRADIAQLTHLAEQLPPNMRPLKTEVTLDRTGAKYLRANEPDLWALIAPAIEVKPGKPGVRIELINKEQ